ncbi:MAG: alcohol dehydrogenase catalytic domain-containing protein [Gemmataceae bacterium]|nr:alcohol dehydrogenase catalytic domain-containing protein [Gemmataceae bacterium]
MAVATATMQALILTDVSKFEIGAIPKPSPGRNEVLCKVDSVAICGTDVHIIEGKMKGRWPRSYPYTPGHEWSGTVVELGEGADVFGWKAGDRVAGTSHAGCGFCRMCTSGRYTLCDNYGDERVHRQYGHYSQGADAQLMVASIRSVFRLPDSISLEEGALVDTASIALHSLKRPGVRPADVAAVIGPGPLGLLCGDCAAAMGASRVIVTGSGERLEKARGMGFEVVDYRAGDVVEQVRALTGGKGVNVCVDSAGTVDSITQAVAMTRKGGRVSFTGVPMGPVALPMQKIVLEELDLFGVRANAGAMEEAIALIEAGRIRAKAIVTHRFPHSQYAEALETFMKRKDGALKVLVKPNE